MSIIKSFLNFFVLWILMTGFDNYEQNQTANKQLDHFSPTKELTALLVDTFFTIHILRQHFFGPTHQTMSAQIHFECIGNNSHFQNPPSPHADIMHKWSLIYLLKKLKDDSQKIIKLLNNNFLIFPHFIKKKALQSMRPILNFVKKRP